MVSTPSMPFEILPLLFSKRSDVLRDFTWFRNNTSFVTWTLYMTIDINEKIQQIYLNLNQIRYLSKLLFLTFKFSFKFQLDSHRCRDSQFPKQTLNSSQLWSSDWTKSCLQMQNWASKMILLVRKVYCKLYLIIKINELL